MNKVNFKTGDGVRLVGVWELPKKPTQKAIVLAHGISVDKDEDGIFTELAKLLKESGFAVFRFDFRGHGESEGNSVDMTITGELKDLDSAINLVKKDYQKIGLLGASFGGSIAALYSAVNKDLFKCLCLWNPTLHYGHTFLNPYLPWLKDKKDQMQKDLAEKSWTEIGSKKFKLGKQLFEEMKKLYPQEALKAITIPTLIVHGDKDTHVPYIDSKEYVSFLENGQLITIREAEHGFHDNKKHRERVLKETLRFFMENL
ncbi:alpha/beta fold hydrolase [Candidatus Microgenomates bacterium]|nr:alpha/beta fold hydrolase [Candidatus Microgenomates bacterium]